jgi:hypothetical protein
MRANGKRFGGLATSNLFEDSFTMRRIDNTTS